MVGLLPRVVCSGPAARAIRPCLLCANRPLTTRFSSPLAVQRRTQHRQRPPADARDNMPRMPRFLGSHGMEVHKFLLFLTMPLTTVYLYNHPTFHPYFTNGVSPASLYPVTDPSDDSYERAAEEALQRANARDAALAEKRRLAAAQPKK